MSRQMAGVQAWILQRVSAVYLGIFTPCAFLFFLFTPPADYAEWKLLMAEPWLYIATLLFGMALLLHAWIGVRDIIIDYVKPFTLRLALLTLTGASLVASGLWTATILLNNYSG